jgi:hypothetical protein
MAWAIEAKAAMDIPLHYNDGKVDVIKKGEIITVTRGTSENYILCHTPSWWSLPKEYIGETVKQLSES